MTATVTITDDAASLSDLRTTVIADRSIAAPGDRITYDWSVGNSGPADTTGTVLTATLDGGVTFVSADRHGSVERPVRPFRCHGHMLARDAKRWRERGRERLLLRFPTTPLRTWASLPRLTATNLTVRPLTTSTRQPPSLTHRRGRSRTCRRQGQGGRIDLTWSAPGDNGSAITRVRVGTQGRNRQLSAR